MTIPTGPLHQSAKVYSAFSPERSGQLALELMKTQGLHSNMLRVSSGSNLLKLGEVSTKVGRSGQGGGLYDGKVGCGRGG